MKTDNYLTLCLEQAANSPLRYRHGCVIVRGGKVIGQGYNEYRAGYDGGALKTGRLPARSLDGPAIAELKRKLKLKPDSNSQPDMPETTKPFTPFENMGGGGPHANTPFSMHSEMMAIHSALAASSQKPYFKLPGDTKRKARLRREATSMPVRPRFKSGALKALHLNRAKLDLALGLCQDREEEVASDTRDSGENHQVKNEKQRHHKGNNNNNNNKNSGAQQPQRHQYARKLSSHDTTAPPRSSTNTATSEEHSSNPTAKPQPPKPHIYKQGKSKTPTPALPSQPQPLLVPKRPTSQSSHSVKERKKSPRLNGADLYVARLGWKTTDSPPSRPNTCCNATEPLPSGAPPSPSPSSGSLHDELTNPGPTPAPAPKPPSKPPKGAASSKKDDSNSKQPSVLASRPCYRCISHMSAVGIKRVFWTTDSGAWEGAKVRDLVDALDTLGAAAQADNSEATAAFKKHEVLMLRRTMGGGRVK
ncbi:hypothetical protein BDV95DRAFT_606565 [Massariosphaeria phaeospora]|uniref:Uncharacterized protein n=1 Tax=Massariosphaeria phaeospora TaxID=100035 RepID=A0A7C8M6J2_9PLEO|nr:hypothetical protein BDV95DRAFT_606565 [Massariosphaeria phaeospora]